MVERKKKKNKKKAGSKKQQEDEQNQQHGNVVLGEDHDGDDDEKKDAVSHDVTDYAAAADAFAARDDDAEEEEESGDDETRERHVDVDKKLRGVDNSDSGSDNDNDSSSSESGSGSSSGSDEEDTNGKDRNDDSSKEDDQDGSDSDDDEDGGDGPAAQPASSVPAGMGSKSNAEPCTFDLRNLLAMNTHPVDPSRLYGNRAKINSNDDDDEKVTIGGPSAMALNESYLQEKAADGCRQLLAALSRLPTTEEKGERGGGLQQVSLPKFDEIAIPRSLPPPPPKQETKWEKFAKEKGIPLNKKKRSRKVFDEATETWMYRTGYQKANDGNKEWPIMEVGANDDPYENPWERARKAKKGRVERNAQSQMRNQERHGALPAGTAASILRNKKAAARKQQRSGKGGDDSVDHVMVPTGVPVDLATTGAAASAGKKKLRGKASTMEALRATQRSTASLGKFDKMREGEPDRKKTLSRMSSQKKQKKMLVSAAGGNNNADSEAKRGLRLFETAMKGGGAAKERDIKKGKLAKGETPYDYDYDDGLGASTFRKKKGRAGAGKAKKMTKKRIK